MANPKGKTTNDYKLKSCLKLLLKKSKLGTMHAT